MSGKGRRLAPWIIGALLVGAAGGAAAVAITHPAVDTSAIDNASQNLWVTAEVVEKPVRGAYAISGQLSEPTLAAVSPLTGSGSTGDSASETAPTTAAQGKETGDEAGGAATGSLPQAVRRVVSATVLTAGESVHWGDCLGEVSGRPVFAFPPSAPLFRDLVFGSSGSDVAALQAVLAEAGLFDLAPTGQFGPVTLAAVKALYQRHGYDLPEPVAGRPGMLLGDTAIVPVDGAKVVSTAPLGAEITAEQPLLTVETAPARVMFRADVLQAEAFAVGAAVSVKFGSGDPLPSAVTAVSAFQAAASSNPAGYDVTVAVPEGVDVAAVAGLPVVVTEAAAAPTGPAVPLAALRRDDQGATYVLVPAAGGATAGPPSRVDVVVVGQDAGWAVIVENPALPVGGVVVVSGQ